MRGRRQAAWWIASILLGTGVAAGVWWAAAQPEDVGVSLAMARTLAIAVLIATPFRNDIADLGQMTFGYALLRLAAYSLIAFCKVILPATAAGSIGNDRQAGRMQDLQMMPIKPAAIYLAKVVAAAVPFGVLGLFLMFLFSGVLIREFVPLGEVGRLILETAGQILLTACVAVTCSALFASSWAARTAAYFLIWVALPCGWLALLLAAGIVPGSAFTSVRDIQQLTSRSEPVGFTEIALLQAAYTSAVCLIAFFLGVRKLRVVGAIGQVGHRSRQRREV